MDIDVHYRYRSIYVSKSLPKPGTVRLSQQLREVGQHAPEACCFHPPPLLGVCAYCVFKLAYISHDCDIINACKLHDTVLYRRADDILFLRGDSN